MVVAVALKKLDRQRPTSRGVKYVTGKAVPAALPYCQDRQHNSFLTSAGNRPWTATLLNINPLELQLRRQIGLLGLMVLVTVSLAAALAVSAHRHSEEARIADAERQIDRALGQLSENFYDFSVSLPERKGSDLLAPDNDALLRKLTSEALSAAPGVEGGFYSVRDARLLGYAFPTYEGRCFVSMTFHPH